MKALLLSINPEHALNILNGKKTLELRKRVPKDFVGWVYVYVTKGGKRLAYEKQPKRPYYILSNSKGVHSANGTIPFRFWFDEHEEVLVQHHIDGEQIERVLKQACIEHDDLDNYVGNKETIYAWHIKNLEVFDKPMMLNEFYGDFVYIDTDEHGRQHNPIHLPIPVKRPPQSWQYVWVKEEVSK